MNDETPDPIAALDQALRAMTDFAKGVRTYHAALIEQGFSEGEAMVLTLAFQEQVMRMTAPE